MRLRCPCCHAEADLQAWAEADGARELYALLHGLDATTGRPLVAYLGLFRAPQRALSWERALRLAREALALEGDAARLGAALSLTVEHLRNKRQALSEREARPLSGHNYLRRVLEGLPLADAASVVPVPPERMSAPRRAAAPSATLDAVQRLEAMKRSALQAADDAGSQA
jgi:hypothetical protein